MTASTPSSSNQPSSASAAPKPRRQLAPLFATWVPHAIVVLTIGFAIDAFFRYPYITEHQPLIARITGYVAIALLLLSLAVSPVCWYLRSAGQAKWCPTVMPWRRSLGIAAAELAFLHALWLWIGVYWAIWSKFLETNFLRFGTISLLILIILWITSWPWLLRLLKLGRGWQAFHVLVYVALPLAVCHALASPFADLDLAWWAAGLTAALILMRILRGLWLALQRWRKYRSAPSPASDSNSETWGRP